MHGTAGRRRSRPAVVQRDGPVRPQPRRPPRHAAAAGAPHGGPGARPLPTGRRGPPPHAGLRDADVPSAPGRGAPCGRRPGPRAGTRALPAAQGRDARGGRHGGARVHDGGELPVRPGDRPVPPPRPPDNRRRRGGTLPEGPCGKGQGRARGGPGRHRRPLALPHGDGPDGHARPEARPRGHGAAKTRAQRQDRAPERAQTGRWGPTVDARGPLLARRRRWRGVRQHRVPRQPRAGYQGPTAAVGLGPARHRRGPVDLGRRPRRAALLHGLRPAGRAAGAVVAPRRPLHLAAPVPPGGHAGPPRFW